MELPNKSPLKENVLITSTGELEDLVREALAEASGTFLKIFAKDKSGKYYVTILFDKTKLLAVECLLVDEKRTLTGGEALSVLRSFAGRPMVVDVYALDEIELKLSIADNVDIYAQTPKIAIDSIFKAEVREEPKPPVKSPTPPREEKKAEEQPKKVKKAEKAKTVEEAPAEKPRPSAPKPAAQGKPKVTVNFRGGELPEKAFQIYAEDILKEAKRIKGLSVSRIEFDAEVEGGVVYLNVRVYGSSTGNARDIEIAEKRMLHAVSKYAPVILREADIKPIIRDTSIIINGEEVKPQEIVEKDKKKTANVTKDGRITLAVLEEVWPYFSAYARTVVGEIEGAGIRVNKVFFDVRGRREFEINLSAVVESNIPKEQIESIVKDVVSRHARELSRSINHYITVHKIELEVPRTPKTPRTAPTPAVTPGKAAEVLAKKADLEKEVEALLKQAGIEELSPLTEEKKQESQEIMLKSRIEPALETLKARVHSELKLIPRVTFKWMKMNHEVSGSTVYLDIETSFVKEDVGGLFGSFSGVSDERVKKDIKDTIEHIVREVGKEYGVGIRLRKLNVSLR
ncbi:hypothetical protein [Thermococcus sp.]|uniref:hypothetical protein n=1 Tax=Thermococcus sp. TaxID=35749 RepID=UPI002622465B|nr:hypothetical protein [Thermococcus sp.]